MSQHPIAPGDLGFSPGGMWRHLEHVHGLTPKEENSRHGGIGSKINTQRSTGFLYACNVQYKNHIKTIPFTIASKRIKYVRINLTEKMKNFYSKHYITMLK